MQPVVQPNRKPCAKRPSLHTALCGVWGVQCNKCDVVCVGRSCWLVWPSHYLPCHLSSSRSSGQTHTQADLPWCCRAVITGITRCTAAHWQPWPCEEMRLWVLAIILQASTRPSRSETTLLLVFNPHNLSHETVTLQPLRNSHSHAPASR